MILYFFICLSCLISGYTIHEIYDKEEYFDNYEIIYYFMLYFSALIPGIKKFMEEDGQVNLAISLHAPNDLIRKKIMPIASVYDMDSLFLVLKKYLEVTNRRITMEYIMLDGINDSEDSAYELASRLKGINCYVNLIPYNETENIGYKRTKREQIMKFYDILKKKNINVTIRKEFGGKVDAACGQLRANQIGG